MKIFIKENINDIEISKSKCLSHFHAAYDFKLDNSKLSIGKVKPTNNWSVRMEINYILNVFKRLSDIIILIFSNRKSGTPSFRLS